MSLYVEKLQKRQFYDCIGEFSYELGIYDLKITRRSIILSSIYLTDGKGQSTVEAIKAAQVDSVGVGRRQGNQADQVTPSMFLSVYYYVAIIQDNKLYLQLIEHNINLTVYNK